MNWMAWPIRIQALHGHACKSFCWFTSAHRLRCLTVSIMVAVYHTAMSACQMVFECLLCGIGEEWQQRWSSSRSFAIACGAVRSSCCRGWRLKRACVLQARPLSVQLDMVPVVEYLRSQGLQAQDILIVVSEHPPVLSYPVEQRLAPFFEYLRSVGFDNPSEVCINACMRASSRAVIFCVIPRPALSTCSGIISTTAPWQLL